MRLTHVIDDAHQFFFSSSSFFHVVGWMATTGPREIHTSQSYVIRNTSYIVGGKCTCHFLFFMFMMLQYVVGIVEKNFMIMVNVFEPLC